MWTSWSTASLAISSRRLEHRADRDVEAEIGEGGGDHLLAAVVAVLSHFGNQDARLAPGLLLEGLDLVLDAVDRRVVADLLAIDAGDGVDLGDMAAEHLLQRQRDLADGRAGARRADREFEQIAVAVRGLGQRVERALDGGDVARALELLQLGELARAHLGIVDLEHIDFDICLGLAGVDADQRLLAGIDARLRARRRFLDAHLRHALLDRRGHAAERLDLLDMGQRARGEVVRQPLDKGRAAPRIDEAGRARTPSAG